MTRKSVVDGGDREAAAMRLHFLASSWFPGGSLLGSNLFGWSSLLGRSSLLGWGILVSWHDDRVTIHVVD